MMKPWQKIKLGDISEIIGGGTPSTKNYDFWNGDIPWLTPRDLSGYNKRYISRGERNITKLGLQNSSARMLPTGTVLLTSRAPIGYVAIAENDVCTNQGFKSIVLKDGYYPEFFYYLLKNNVDYIIGMGSGSTFAEISGTQVKNLEFTVPPIDVQKKIAGVLGALDDKIELNQRQNNNLEQQAQALFKSWFVEMKSGLKDEKFGCIPDDAQVCKIGDLPVFITDYVANGSFASLKENVTLYQTRNYAYFIRNTDLKANSFEVYVDEHSYKFLAKSSLFGNEIIISNVGDVGSVFLCPKLDLPMTLGNNIIMLRADKDSDLGFYLYVWFKWSYGQELIQGIKGGSAQPKFNKTDFKGLPVILPPKEQLKKFNKLVTPMFDKISQNQQENKQLAALRDTLLPKLMKGEIDVSNVDISALTSTDKLSFSEE